MKVKIVRVLSQDRTQICQTQEELTAYLETLEDGDTLTLELKQEVPVEASTDVWSDAFRMQGHAKWGELKEKKTLVAWENFAKLGFVKSGLRIGEELEGQTLRETYVPITKLSTKFGLDKLGNVTDEPVVRVSTNEILLYKFLDGDNTNLIPMFRRVSRVTGNYVPFAKPSAEEVAYPTVFTGIMRGPNNRKTPEYQAYLNELYKTFVTPEDMDAAEAVKEEEFVFNA